MTSSPVWFPRSWLPNQLGFKFKARKIDGTLVDGEVTVYGPHKLHTTKDVHYRDIAEWCTA